MSRYNDSSSDPQTAAARMQSYTGKAVVALVLYCVLWLPGLIANILFYQEAKRMERIAGQSLPGVGCLTIMLWLSVASIAIGVLLVLLLFLGGVAASLR